MRTDVVSGEESAALATFVLLFDARSRHLDLGLADALADAGPVAIAVRLR